MERSIFVFSFGTFYLLVFAFFMNYWFIILNIKENSEDKSNERNIYEENNKSLLKVLFFFLLILIRFFVFFLLKDILIHCCTKITSVYVHGFKKDKATGRVGNPKLRSSLIWKLGVFGLRKVLPKINRIRTSVRFRSEHFQFGSYFSYWFQN